jgi:16S rRNA G966 N2-methylase RsmD
VDLFAGTGSLGIEALSRGAARAVFYERHFPTASRLERTLQEFGLSERARVQGADTLVWVKRPAELEALQQAGRWLVFVSPPWDMFHKVREKLLGLVATMIESAPAGSLFVVESDVEFDPAGLPRPEAWRVRDYAPARVAILKV